jgi:hypothetical protein
LSQQVVVRPLPLRTYPNSSCSKKESERKETKKKQRKGKEKNQRQRQRVEPLAGAFFFLFCLVVVEGVEWKGH